MCLAERFLRGEHRWSQARRIEIDDGFMRYAELNKRGGRLFFKSKAKRVIHRELKKQPDGLLGSQCGITHTWTPYLAASILALDNNLVGDIARTRNGEILTPMPASIDKV